MANANSTAAKRTNPPASKAGPTGNAVFDDLCYGAFDKWARPDDDEELAEGDDV